MTHFRTPTLALIAGACLSLLGTNALAESTYGYAPSGTGQVKANAHHNLVINVPNLILLRVGSAGAVMGRPLIDPSIITMPREGRA